MPCRDWEADTGNHSSCEATARELQKKCDELTAQLCFACSQLSDYFDVIGRLLENGGKGVTPEAKRLNDWWKRHRELDRIAAERARLKEIERVALSKLTREEKNVLGLK